MGVLCERPFSGESNIVNGVGGLNCVLLLVEGIQTRLLLEVIFVGGVCKTLPTGVFSTVNFVGLSLYIGILEGLDW